MVERWFSVKSLGQGAMMNTVGKTLSLPVALLMAGMVMVSVGEDASLGDSKARLLVSKQVNLDITDI